MTNYDGLYNKNYYGEKIFENHFADKKLGFKVIENGIIFPHVLQPYSLGFGGICDAEGNFIDRSFVHAGAGMSAPYSPKEIKSSSETVIYFGMMIHIWGHCLTDNIKRVWFLKSKIFQKNFKNCPVVYLPSFDGIIPNFVKLLNILEIDIQNLREIKTPTKFKKIILPDESFFLDKGKTKNFDCAIEGSYDNFKGNDCSFFTQEYFETVEQVRNFAQKNFTPLAQKKFFFYHGANQIGEKNLANYFSDKGYETIVPTNFSLEEQLNIFLNCENFASVIGSISHNIIFTKDNTQAILIPRRAAFLNIYQLALDQLHDMEIFYIDSAMSIYAANQVGPFCYIISEQLTKFFGNEVTEKFSAQDFYNFLTYAKYAKREGYELNSQDEKYFSELILEFMQRMKNFKLSN